MGRIQSDKPRKKSSRKKHDVQSEEDRHKRQDENSPQECCSKAQRKTCPKSHIENKAEKRLSDAQALTTTI